MSRPVAALAAFLLLAGAARGQEARKPEDKKAPAAAQPAAPPPAAEKPAAAQPPAAQATGELDPATRAAIQREVEKARDQIRDEVRAELQGAQSAAEFLGAVAEGPKLEFLQLDGYFRFRGQLLNSLDLGHPADPGGFYLFPHPLGSSTGGSLAAANMRLRLEPTLNVSELVRVRAQVDVLDNYVLGSSTSKVFDDPYSPYPVPFYGASRVLYPNDPTADRAPVLPKRAWAEVQTPVGLLSFGRMPSEWGLGILTNAGGGIDDDYGDSVDRIQFALPPVATPIGALTFVPMLDFDNEGVLQSDLRFGPGVGQPFDLDSADDARTYAIKIARVDTEDEIRRKHDRGDGSFNFGGYYNYRTQRSTFPTWTTSGFSAPVDPNIEEVHRGSYGHIFSVWARWLGPRWRLEAEGAGVIGTIGVASTVLPASALQPVPVVGPTPYSVELRQWGGTVQTDFKAIPNKVTLGAELGIASGDPAPGFGNVPNRIATDAAGAPALPSPGAIEGPQHGGADHSIANFRFNPAYRVDLVLWREILGQVTDAWYLKPRIKWDIFSGLAFDGALVYSQALYASSTPSSTSKMLGVELDTGLTYTSASGFQAFLQWGILQPLDGLGTGLKRGQNLSVGLAAKF
jgi:uncharacterized protein (TIGR04551 family)